MGATRGATDAFSGVGRHVNDAVSQIIVFSVIWYVLIFYSDYLMMYPLLLLSPISHFFS